MLVTGCEHALKAFLYRMNRTGITIIRNLFPHPFVFGNFRTLQEFFRRSVCEDSVFDRGMASQVTYRVDVESSREALLYDDSYVIAHERCTEVNDPLAR